MPYIPPSVVREVKRMNLLTYLKNYEPYELVHFSGNTYTTRTHDSLKISNGKWMWWSQRTGGRSALDYLIKVRGYSFLEAVELLAERANIQPPLLNISTEQMGYITNADAGCGLVKYGSSLVPFVNRFPTNTRLYKLMTTKPGEDSINRGRM